MDKQLPDHEIHALHIIDLFIVAGERTKNIPKPDVSLGLLLEVWIQGEGAAKVTLDLRRRPGGGLHQSQALVMVLALLVLLEDCLTHERGHVRLAVRRHLLFALQKLFHT